ncbi:MAG: Fe-S cluster assembly protein SufD [Cyclobacteriaceae bacterium]|jgi:Fe-S cluster assembly protein SufD
MSTLTQSTLTGNLLEAIEKSAPSTMNKTALENLLKSGLPGRKHEEYRFTPITASLEKQCQSGILINTPGTSSATLPVIAGAHRFVFVNGVLQNSSELPTGVRFSENKIEKLRDAFGQLNESFRQSSLVLTCSESCDQVLHIHHECTTQDQASLSFPAIHLTVEPGAEITVVETLQLQGTGYHFSAPVIQMEVGSKATCHYIRLQNASGNLDQVYHSVIRQQEDSRVHAFILTSEGNIIRNNFTLEVDGERAEGNLMGLYLLNGKTLADNHTVVDHRVPNANSNEMFKGVMQGNSKGVFNGKIFVRQDAQKTNAFQSNRNIVLSDSASVNTKPQLEIWADDVKCSHGCTTGQLDDEALFYLESRGIDKPTAQSMLLDAFAGEVIEKIASDSLREYVRELVLKKIDSLK